eukprot:TRINITY_DN27044_c0_g2_i1.p1 TRINITY_DN27044_c0_g2~~TRINITY_DN27044_c0_g2_i1.p1  ORF type:complete len:679 (-),score=150.43 TRINITY_DN27044_c0_g2_i1:93-1946(-)
MRYVGFVVCRWLISPSNPRSFDQIVLRPLYVSLVGQDSVTISTVDELGDPVDTLGIITGGSFAAMRNTTDFKITTQEKAVLVSFDSGVQCTLNGFILNYTVERIPLSTTAIALVLVAIIICSTAVVVLVVLVATRIRRWQLHQAELEAMASAEVMTALVKTELRECRAGNATTLAALRDAGITLSKDSLSFGLPEGSAAKVMKPMDDQVTLTNTSGTTVQYCFFVPDCTYVFQCKLTPGQGHLRAHSEVNVTVQLTLMMTTHVEQAIRLDVQQHGVVRSVYVGVNLEGEMSTHLDPDDLKLDAAPVAVGAVGSVFHGTYRSRSVAIKILTHQEAFTKEEMAEFERECDLLTKLRHPCIASFIGSSHVPGRLCICMAWVPSGSLKSFLSSTEELPLALLLKFAINTAEAMVFLHENKILYRDLKCSNILVVSTSLQAEVNCQLTDFGTSRNVENPELVQVYTAKVGTPLYMAPEILKGEKYNHKVDVFSYGMCLWEMCTREEVWGNVMRWDIPDKVKAGERPPMPLPATTKAPQQLQDLITQCWAPFPDDRPNFADALAVLGDLLRSVLEPERQHHRHHRHHHHHHHHHRHTESGDKGKGSKDESSTEDEQEPAGEKL